MLCITWGGKKAIVISGRQPQGLGVLCAFLTQLVQPHHCVGWMGQGGQGKSKLSTPTAIPQFSIVIHYRERFVQCCDLLHRFNRRNLNHLMLTSFCSHLNLLKNKNKNIVLCSTEKLTVLSVWRDLYISTFCYFWLVCLVFCLRGIIFGVESDI